VQRTRIKKPGQKSSVLVIKLLSNFYKSLSIANFAKTNVTISIKNMIANGLKPVARGFSEVFCVIIDKFKEY
jgi:hypothetical protein